MDSNKLFDDMVKSTLENGVEEVPAELWKNIEAKLTEGSLMKRGWWKRAWWKRAAVAAALACLAAGILVLRKPGAVEEGKVRMGEAVAEVMEGVVEESAVEAAIETVVRTETAAAVSETVATPEHAAVSEIVAESVTEPDPVGEVAGKTAVSETIAESVPETEPVPVSAPKAETVAETEPITVSGPVTEFDPLTFGQDVPGRKDGMRLSITANTNAAGNAGESSAVSSRFATSRMDFGTCGKLTETNATSYLIPISAGVAVRFNFNKRWALGIGLSYTYLNRHFEGLYDYGGTENFFCKDVSNDQHFIGIPVTAYFNIISSGIVHFYAYAGGSIEKCVSNRYGFDYYRNRTNLYQTVPGMQFSADAGIGLQVNVAKNFGIYLDPSFRYYFKNYLQPKSIRTVQPFQIGAELGFRWDL